MIRGTCTSRCDGSFDSEVSCQMSTGDMLGWIMCSYCSNACDVSTISAVLCLLTFRAFTHRETIFEGFRRPSPEVLCVLGRQLSLGEVKSVAP